MHKLRGVAAALVVAASASFAAAAHAATAVATGDTCVANSTGTQYTLTVQLGANAPQQDGFAVGVHGGKVTQLAIGGVNGKVSTTGLPSGTDAAWLFGSPQGVPGAQVTINVHANTASAKMFTVVAYDQEHQTWFDPFTCAVSKLVKTAGTSAFTIVNRFTYNAGTHSWLLSVKVPGPGTLNVSQDGGAKVLIVNRRIKAGAAGTAKVALVPTAAGRAAFTQSGMLKLRLSVEFSPSNGIKPMTKTLSVMLRK